MADIDMDPVEKGKLSRTGDEGQNFDPVEGNM